MDIEPAAEVLVDEPPRHDSLGSDLTKKPLASVFARRDLSPLRIYSP